MQKIFLDGDGLRFAKSMHVTLTHVTRFYSWDNHTREWSVSSVREKSNVSSFIQNPREGQTKGVPSPEESMIEPLYRFTFALEGGGVVRLTSPPQGDGCLKITLNAPEGVGEVDDG